MNNMLKLTLAIMFALCLGMIPAAAEVEKAQGQILFEKYKCAQCHSIKALGIEVDESLVEEGEEKEPEDPDAPKPPDMLKIDPDRDPGVKHTKSWTSKYLRKKIAIGERFHTKRFKGTKVERKELINWLFEIRKK